jgi:peptidyl-prolyl cis-trans isomerase C
MLRFTKILAAGALALAAATPSFSQEAGADTVVASVNGNDITLGHMIAMLDALPEQYKQLPDDVLFQGILEQLIQQSLLAETVTPAPRSVELQLENDRRALLASLAMEELVSAAATDEALQALYDERFANVDPGTEYNASHILVKTEEEAKAVIAELEAGADFAELAREKSTGPSGPNGGALGWFGKGTMVAPFEEAVVALKPGEISGPVQTQFGWHVIKLNETRPAPKPTLDEVRQTLLDEIQQRTIEAKLQELTAKADIQRPDVSGIDPALLRNLDLIR